MFASKKFRDNFQLVPVERAEAMIEREPDKWRWAASWITPGTHYRMAMLFKSGIALPPRVLREADCF